MLSSLTRPHGYPATLIAEEGIDGSDERTQPGRLAKWLAAEGLRLSSTGWNSSAIVKAARAGNQETALTPLIVSPLHASDFGDNARTAPQSSFAASSAIRDRTTSFIVR